MELGCSTLLYGGYELKRSLESIASIGYKAIELCSIPGMAEHVSPDGTDEDYADVRTMVNTAGLEIESVGASCNLLDPDGRERYEALMGVAAVLGAPAITSGPGGIADDEESFQQVLNTLQELGDRGEALGVRVSIKPHVRAAIYNTPTALRAMEELDHPWVGLNVDGSHLWRANEDPEETIPMLLPHLFSARVRDTLSRETPIGPVETQVPGGGAMDLQGICDAFYQKKDLRFLTLEIVGTKGFAFEDIEKVAADSFHTLRSMID
jgi:sugar phosphate isomerase/epimerase